MYNVGNTVFATLLLYAMEAEKSPAFPEKKAKANSLLERKPDSTGSRVKEKTIFDRRKRYDQAAFETVCEEFGRHR